MNLAITIEPKVEENNEANTINEEDQRRMKRAQSFSRNKKTIGEKNAMKRIIIYAIVLMLLGCLVLGLSFLLDHYAHITWLFYFVLGIGAALAALNLILIVIVLNPLPGFKQIIRFYYALIVFLNIVLLVVAILAFVIPNEIAEFAQDNIYEEEDIEKLEELINSTYDKIFIIVIILGIILLVMVGLLTIMAMQMSNMVGWKRSNEIIMLVCDIIIVAPGCIAIVMGFYIYDTAQTIDAPKTGFILFVIGVIMIFVMILNLLGKALFSKFFYYATAVISGLCGLILFIFGIVIAIIKPTIVDFCVDKWKVFRLVLTPTFIGKYDPSYFEDWLNQYMKLAAAVIIIYGIILIIYAKTNRDIGKKLELFIYYRLFRSFDQDNDGRISAQELSDIMLSQEIDVDEEDLKDMFWNHNIIDEDKGLTLSAYFDICEYKDHVYEIAEYMEENNLYDPNEIHDNESFKVTVLRAYLAFYNFQYSLYEDLERNSKKCAHKCLICLIVLAFIVLIIIFVIFGLFFLFPAVCEGMTNDRDFEFVNFDTATKSCSIDNHVNLGDIEVKNDETNLAGVWSASGRMKSIGGEDDINKLLTMKSNNRYEINPDGSTVLGVDFKCQIFTMRLSSKAGDSTSFSNDVLNLNSYSEFSGIDYDNDNLVSEINAKSTNGPIKLYNFYTKKLNIETSSGDITIKNGRVECGENTQNIQIVGDKNQVDINGMVTKNCKSLYINGVAGNYIIKDIKGESDNDDIIPQLTIISERGGIRLNGVNYPRIRIDYKAGSVNIENVTTNELKVSTTEATVNINLVTLKTGILQVETLSGNTVIKIKTSSDQYRGIYNIQTKGATDTSLFNNTETIHNNNNNGMKDETGAYTGYVGCDTYNACSYLGNIIVMSNTGTVTLQDYNQYCEVNIC